MLLNIFVPKANHTYEIETDLLPETSNEYATTYGFRQCLVDPTAGVKRSDFDSDEEFHAAAREKADKRMAQLESGMVPGTRVVATKEAKVKQLAAALNIPMETLAQFLAQREAAGLAA
jgi:hypothetical protein